MNAKNNTETREASTKHMLGNGLGSASTSSIATQNNNGFAKHKSSHRATSAKYYDIASTILGGSGDVEEVFLNAAKNGNLNKLEQLLEQRNEIGLDIDCKDKRTGNTALIWAAKRGQSKMVELLLRHGCDATLCNYEAQTALETAFSPIRTLLLDWVENQTELNEKLLLQAAWQGNLSVVLKILTNKRNIDVNCQNAEGLTPVMLVSRDVQLFERLSTQLNRYYSPVQVAEELMKAKANIHVTDNDGRSSLHYASQSRAGCADALISALVTGGMDVELRDKRLFTPIHLASQLGNTNNVTALADGGSDVNVKGFAGLTPLHMTAYNDHHKTAVTLLNHGADVTITDDRGLNPLDLAKTRRMKMALKEAWTEATKSSRSEPESAVSTVNNVRDEGKKKRGANQKKKPEVIFDDVIDNSAKPSTVSQAAKKTYPPKVLSNVERCKQAEKKILQEVEALKATHPVLQRESTRMLGTSRSKVLPHIGRSSSPDASNSHAPASREHYRSPSRASSEVQKSLEDARAQLISRGRSVSDIKLGVGRQSERLSIDDDVTSEDCQSSRLSRTARDGTSLRHRSGSDPATPSLRELTASCDKRLTTSRDKRTSLPNCQQQSPRHNSTTSQMFATQKSSRVICRNKNNVDLKGTVQQEEDLLRSMESPFDLVRCRSVLKEEFILEESRPKEIVSGSDPTSSISSSSLSSSSPRDHTYLQQSPIRSLRHDSPLTTLVEQRATTDFSKSALDFLNKADGKPLIRNPQQRLRRKSENALSSSVESDTETDFKSKSSLMRSHSLRKSNEETANSSVHKSQSMDCISPRIQVENPSAFQKTTATKSNSEGNLNSSKKNADSVQHSKPASVPNTSQPKPRQSKPSSSSSNKVPLSKKWAVEPFSGKARILSDETIDYWDSSVSDTNVGKSPGKEKLFCSKPDVTLPTKSDQNPANSSCGQNLKTNNSTVTKSCTGSLQENKTRNNVMHQRPQTAAESTNLCNGPSGNSSQKSVRPGDRATPKSSAQSADTAVAAPVKVSRSNTIAQSSLASKSVNNMANLHSSKSSDQTPPSKFSGSSAHVTKPPDVTRISSDVSEQQFVITEASVRLSSAGKQRLDEQKAQTQEKPQETANTQTRSQKTSSGTDDSKSILANKAAFIEKNIMRNQKKVPTNSCQTKSKIMAKGSSKPLVSARNGLKEDMGTAKPVTSRGVENVSTAKPVTTKVSENVGTAKPVTTKVSENVGTAKPVTTKVSDNVGTAKPVSSKTIENVSIAKPATSKATGSNKVESKSVVTQKTLVQKVADNTKKTTDFLRASEKSAAVPGNVSHTAAALSEKSSQKTIGSQSSEVASQKNVKGDVSKKKDDSKSAFSTTTKPDVVSQETQLIEPLVKIRFLSSTVTKETTVPSTSTVTSSVSNTSTSTCSHQKQEPIVTPLIVDPFEEYLQTHIKVIENTSSDAVVKMKKNSSNKQKKKNVISSSKRPSSGSSRQTSAGKKKGGKDKETKAEKEIRPKSSKKSGKGQRNKKGNEGQITETEVSVAAAKNDTAIISGIGWQLSASCHDTSDIHVSKDVHFDSSDSESPYNSDKEDITVCDEGRKTEAVEPLNKHLLEALKDKITEHSPRFLELKRRENSTLHVKLPLVEDDGFPPMNLDLTQNAHSQYNGNRYVIEGEDYLKELSFSESQKNNDIQREIFMGKLTPIPEVSLLSRTTNAISAFDKSIRGSKLSLLLNSATLDNEVKDSEIDTADVVRDKNISETSEKQGSLAIQKRSGQTERENAEHRVVLNYEYTPSGKVIRRTQSLREFQETGGRRSEFKFSESQNPLRTKNNKEEDDIDEVIDEILSSTTSSMASTLRKWNQSAGNLHPSGVHTLTEGDRNMLLKMTSAKYGSPFHANTLDDSPTHPETTDRVSELQEKVQSKTSIVPSIKDDEPASVRGSQNLSPSHASVTSKPPLSSRSSMKEERTARKVPIGRSLSTKEHRRSGNGPDGRQQLGHTVSDEEAKQLAKVINSFKHMELHASTQRIDGIGGSAKSPTRQSKNSISDLNGTSRPSSMGASLRSKGKFLELKDATTTRISGDVQDPHMPGAENEKIELKTPDLHFTDESVLDQITSAADLALALGQAEINLDTRRGSIAGSEYTVVSNKSGVNDTIQWKKGNVLGRGAFGTVWCGLTNEGQLIAVKQIELTAMDKTKTQHEYEKVQEEVELLKTLNHANIVGYLGTSLEDNIVSIFMQFIPGGSIASILARFGALDESVFRRYTKQILEGVKYLHANDVIHRDLKGANVMLMPTGVIKLIDFGCAKRLCINLSISQAEVLKSMKGTPFWMAPEVVNETGHGKKSDVWSIGCTVFEMATRKPPWADMNPMAAIFAIGSLSRPVPTLDEKFSQDARDFVSQCMTRDQDTRPSACELLEHPFIIRRNGGRQPSSSDA